MEEELLGLNQYPSVVIPDSYEGDILERMTEIVESIEPEKGKYCRVLPGGFHSVNRIEAIANVGVDEGITAVCTSMLSSCVAVALIEQKASKITRIAMVHIVGDLRIDHLQEAKEEFSQKFHSIEEGYKRHLLIHINSKCTSPSSTVYKIRNYSNGRELNSEVSALLKYLHVENENIHLTTGTTPNTQSSIAINFNGKITYTPYFVNESFKENPTILDTLPKERHKKSKCTIL